MSHINCIVYHSHGLLELEHVWEGAADADVGNPGNQGVRIEHVPMDGLTTSGSLTFSVLLLLLLSLAPRAMSHYLLPLHIAKQVLGVLCGGVLTKPVADRDSDHDLKPTFCCSL